MAAVCFLFSFLHFYCLRGGIIGVNIMGSLWSLMGGGRENGLAGHCCILASCQCPFYPVRKLALLPEYLIWKKSWIFGLKTAIEFPLSSLSMGIKVLGHWAQSKHNFSYRMHENGFSVAALHGLCRAEGDGAGERTQNSGTTVKPRQTLLATASAHGTTSQEREIENIWH